MAMLPKVVYEFSADESAAANYDDLHAVGLAIPAAPSSTTGCGSCLS